MLNSMETIVDLRLSLRKTQFPVLVSVLLGLLSLASVNLAAQATLPPYLPQGADCSVTTYSPSASLPGLNPPLEAGIALADADGNSIPDIVLADFSPWLSPHMPIPRPRFFYKIGWNYSVSGHTSSNWTNAKVRQWQGNYRDGRGTGVALANLGGGPAADNLLAAYVQDGATNQYSFVYQIGYDITAPSGDPTLWDNTPGTAPGFGKSAEGIGVAVADLNNDGAPDIVLGAYTPEAGRFEYRVGWSIDSHGNPASWTTPPSIAMPKGSRAAFGADLTIADIDHDGSLDLVVMVYEPMSSRSRFVYRVGFELDVRGRPAYWTRAYYLNGVGASVAGAGIAYVAWKPPGPFPPGLVRQRQGLLFVAGGAAQNLVLTVPVTISGTTFGIATDGGPAIDNNLVVPTSIADENAGNLFNLNMRNVHDLAQDALTDFLAHCSLNPNDNACSHAYPDSGVNYAQLVTPMTDFLRGYFPDVLVAAVAWYINQNMGWVNDDANGYVLNTIFSLNYQPGGEGMPANYIIRFTDPIAQPNLIARLQEHNPEWARAYNDGRQFHGDCEDFAIMRHALLRALGFDRRFIWNVRSPGHEFNVVLYRGVLRVMDYGPIHRGFDADAFSCIDQCISAAWNEPNGPRFSPNAGDFLKQLVLPRITPDSCISPTGFLFTREASPDRNQCGR